MRKKTGKMAGKAIGLLLAACMAAGLAPATASAAGIAAGTPALTVNQSKVAFAGHEWWVIGDEASGVYPQSGHLTLLAANLDSDFQNVPFRKGQKDAGDGYAKYTGENGFEYCYANNPGGMQAWTTPNEYAGSTLQQKMAELANEIPDKEQAVISARSLTGGGTYQNPSADGIAGSGVANQKLWALSLDEWKTINNGEVGKYGSWFWLRLSYNGSSILSWAIPSSGTSFGLDNVASSAKSARPALSLDLSSVLFTSSASDMTGKSSATVGGSLVGAEAAIGTVKYTMKDSRQTLTVNATKAQSTQTGETLSFGYSDATIGANQYISCVLTDNSGAVEYYGKLADSSSAASGNLSIPLSGVADGTYALSIFSEEANGAMYTDFCSEPVTMTLTVSNGMGTVSKFGGTLHEHSWSDKWQKNESHHWHDCVAEGCPVTDNSLKDGYALHSYNQTVMTGEYLKSAADCESPATYYKSCVCGAFSETADTFTSGVAVGHSWGDPVWKWSDDGKAATVTFTCRNDNSHVQNPEVNVTSEAKTAATCTERGTTTYAAKATFNGQEYTGTKDVTDIAATGHNFKDGECAVCHEKDPAFKKQEAQDGAQDGGNALPRTGDPSAALLEALLPLGASAALAGAAMLGAKRYER